MNPENHFGHFTRRTQVKSVGTTQDRGADHRQRLLTMSAFFGQCRRVGKKISTPILAKKA
jgi:hypothetical protein